MLRSLSVRVVIALLLGLGLVLSSRVESLWQLYVTFGFMVGFAVGAFYAPLTSTATKWFTARRGLAVALVSAGIGVGILVISPLARALISWADWRMALLVSLPQSPERLRPDRNGVAARSQRDNILRRMSELGLLTSRDAAEAADEPIDGCIFAERPHSRCEYNQLASDRDGHARPIDRLIA